MTRSRLLVRELKGAERRPFLFAGDRLLAHPDLLKGRSLMVSPLLSAEEFAPMRPAIGLALVLLAIAFECWHRRAGRRATLAPPNERAAIAAAESTSG